MMAIPHRRNDCCVRGRFRVLMAFRRLGDAVVATPALRAARQAWPNAAISLLTGPTVATLLRGCPYVEDFVVFAPSWHEWEPVANFRLIQRLRRRKFDRAIVFNRAAHPTFAAAAAGIPERIGCDTALLTRRIHFVPERSEIDMGLDLVGAAGANFAERNRHTELWITELERRQARDLFASRGLALDRPVIGMQPGAEHDRRREWGVARFAAVGDRLARWTGARILLMGSRKERPASEQVAAAMTAEPLILTGETDLRLAVAAISCCQMWIGNDSGLLHVAAALGLATVGIFRSAPLARRWGYSGPRHRSLHADGLNAVTEESVAKAALEVWPAEPAEVRRPVNRSLGPSLSAPRPS